MENRFLCRAKRIDNGEWVEGMPFEIEGKTIILLNMWNAEIYCVEVDPSTICRCAGLKDKDGKLIQENDIVKDNVSGNTFDNPELLEVKKP